MPKKVKSVFVLESNKKQTFFLKNSLIDGTKSVYSRLSYKLEYKI